MPIVGDIKNLYSDVEKTRALFPTTKVEAVSDEDGTGLNVILENMVYTGNAVEDSEVIPVNADTLGGRLAEEYATQNYVATKIAEAQLGGDGGDIDLSGYATKDEVSNHTNDKNNPHGMTIAQIGAAPDGYVTYTGWFNSEDMLDSKLTESYSAIADGKIGFAELESTSNAITLTQGKWFFTMYRSSAEYGVVTAIRYDSANVVAIMQRSLIGGTWGAWQNGSPSAFAPAGYGFGEKVGRYCADCHVVTQLGLYYVDENTANLPNGVISGVLMVEGRHTTYNNGVDLYLTLKREAEIWYCYYSSWAGAWQPWVEGSPSAFAPGGYGLGQAQASAPENNDANLAIYNGVYTVYSSTVNSPQLDGVLVVSTRSYGYAHQTLIPTYYKGCVITRQQDNGTWGNWEWLNPPMAPGTEYRTLERWQGKPVYTKLLSFGALPNGTEKSFGHGITDMEHPLSIDMFCTNGNWEFTLPSAYATETTVAFNTSTVIVTTTNNRSSYDGYAILKYTKK